jgi:hypothetical protein
MAKEFRMPMSAVRLSLATGLLTALAGCVTIPSNVVPIGKDTYQLSMTGVGFATQANTNIKALKAAGQYCDAMGKHLVFQHSAESGVYGFSPRQNNLVFLCLDANDPGYVRGDVHSDPAIVVQGR